MTTMTTLYFLRHGAREAGPGNNGLSPLGRQQVRALARRLALRHIDAIYCSPTLCSWETGVTVSTGHRLPLLFDARLRERANWGDVPHQSLAEYLAVWQVCNRHRDHVQPGGVSSRQAGARIEQLVKDAHGDLPDGAVAAISHSAALMDFLRNVFSLETLARLDPAVYRDPYSSGVIPEASLTVVRYDGQQYSIERLGDSDHLARLFQRPNATLYTPRMAATMATPVPA
jgi:broad specificity phosphatase PhoE